MEEEELREGKDGVAFDPDLLQIQEASLVAIRGNTYVVEKLYEQWLVLPETVRLVNSLIEDAKTGMSLNVNGISNGNAVSSNLVSSMFPAGSAPPLSPRSPSVSPRVTKCAGSGPSPLGSPLRLVSEKVREVIPQFYFENGRPPPSEEEQCLSRIDELFSGYLDGLQIQEFKLVTKGICKLPSFLSSVLFRKIDAGCTGFVTRDAFIDYWVHNSMMTMDTPTQIFTIMKQSDRNYLTQEDVKPVLQELLDSHPGLEFLQATPEFQQRYGIFHMSTST